MPCSFLVELRAQLGKMFSWLTSVGEDIQCKLTVLPSNKKFSSIKVRSINH